MRRRSATRRTAGASVVALTAILAGMLAAPAAQAVTCPPATINGTPGQRVKSPDAPEVYLIDNTGTRRWIPSEAVYNNLFPDWNGIRVNSYTPCMRLGTPLTGASLVKSTTGTAVYLAFSENGQTGSRPTKHHIVSVEAFNKYSFDWNKIKSIQGVLLAEYPIGANWQ